MAVSHATLICTTKQDNSVVSVIGLLTFVFRQGLYVMMKMNGSVQIEI